MPLEEGSVEQPPSAPNGHGSLLFRRRSSTTLEENLQRNHKHHILINNNNNIIKKNSSNSTPKPLETCGDEKGDEKDNQSNNNTIGIITKCDPANNNTQHPMEQDDPSPPEVVSLKEDEPESDHDTDTESDSSTNEDEDMTPTTRQIEWLLDLLLQHEIKSSATIIPNFPPTPWNCSSDKTVTPKKAIRKKIATRHPTLTSTTITSLPPACWNGSNEKTVTPKKAVRKKMARTEPY